LLACSILSLAMSSVNYNSVVLILFIYSCG